MHPRAYLPVDIARRAFRPVGRSIWPSDSPASRVLPVHGDFTDRCCFPRPATRGPGALCTSPARRSATSVRRAATSLLRTIAWLVGDGGGLLIGFDLDKDESIVWPAYNDRRGVSAAFNLNLLERINRELGADFDRERFSHRAEYVRSKERMEMHLVSQKEQVVRVGGHGVRVRAGRTIHTEYSYKYSLEHFRRLTSRAGFATTGMVRSARYFAVQYLVVDSGSSTADRQDESAFRRRGPASRTPTSK